jgi:glucan phosphoethanolaminetransferase (alkaline phosphatase superfamily)
MALTAILISFAISILTLYRAGKFYSGQNLLSSSFRECYLNQHPFSLLNESYVFAKIKMRTYKYRAEHDRFKFGILNPNDTTVKPKLVIFIIGERMRFLNWSINGYKRETNPDLEKIPNLVAFSKNYSNSNITYGSIPLIVTQATPLNPQLAYSQKSIVSLFKEAGFETSWISSQYVFDIVNERKVPDHVYELYKKPHTDMAILPAFDSVINRKTTRDQFIVINMLGGHGRVPEQFDVFKPNDSHEDYVISMKNAPIFINSNDNLILFQDYILSEIMKRVLKKNVSSVVMFTADHGCNLFDNGKALFGYGTSNPTEKEARVPMLIDLSDKFIEQNPGKYKNLINNKNLLTTNNDLFYTAANLADIKYKYYDKRMSISDSAYAEPSSRFLYVNGKLFKFKK